MKVLRYSILVLAFLACKNRDSELSLRPGLEDLLVFGQREARDICSRDILIFYAGNAEGLGPVHFLPGLRSEFGDEYSANYFESETRNEERYFSEIELQARKLLQVVSDTRPEDAGKGKGIEVCERINLRDPGRVVLVQATDGPNKRLVQQSDGSFEIASRAADSRLSIQEFSFEDRKWTETTPRDWPRRLGTNPMGPLARGQQFEMFMPEDIGKVQDWLVEFLSGYGYEEGFDQTIFFLKSHGAQRTYTQDPNGVALDQMTVPQGSAANSVFMFDHDTRASERGTVANYFYPLWSPRSVCENAAKNDPSLVDRCIQRLIEASVDQSELTQSSRVRRVPLSGFTLGSGPWRGETQGFFGSNVIFGGGPWHNRESHIRYLPYVQSEAAPYDIQLPLTKTAVDQLSFGRSELNGFPEGFRFLGDAIALNKQNESQRELRLLPGKKNASLVVLDTCSVNLTPLLGSRGVPWMQDAKVPLAVLSNPLPVLAKAVDYGMLDPFQIAYLATLLGQADDSGLDSRRRSKIDRILEILQSDPELSNDDETPFERLRLTLFKCDGSEEDCFAFRPLDTVFAVEQAYLALEELYEQVTASLEGSEQIDFGTFHELTTGFNDGLIRILSGRTPIVSELTYRDADVRDSLGAVINAMNQNFLLRQGSQDTVSRAGIMRRMLELWSYYAEDVLYVLKRTSFRNRWKTIFENGSLEDIMIQDMVLISIMIEEGNRSGGLSDERKDWINGILTSLMRSYYVVTTSFRPAIRELRVLADRWERSRTDVFSEREQEHLETFMAILLPLRRQQQFDR